MTMTMTMTVTRRFSKAVLMGAVATALLGARSARAERPLLSAGIGAGVDVEPSRAVGMPTHDVQASVAAFSFEGELLWRHWGLLVRGVGVDGSIEYNATGFDRLAFTLGGTIRPLAFWARTAGPSYGALLLRRLTLEGGLVIQRLEAAFSAGNGYGLHLGAHADFPLLRRDRDAGPFIRVTVQHPFILSDALIRNGINPNLFEPGDPVLQGLAILGVVF